MSHKKLSKEKIINAFLFSSFDKSAGATSLQDISDVLQIKKASLYNHFSSRDEMYLATLEYCRENLDALNFIPDEIRLSGKLGQESLSLTLKKILKRYINLYEAEPLFQIYSFINSEKFFNSTASKIADKEYEKIYFGVEEIFKILIKNEKCRKLSSSELKYCVNAISSIIKTQTDLYLTQKKEIVRLNPECGVGSLFALPTDDAALNLIIKTVENFSKILNLGNL